MVGFEDYFGIGYRTVEEHVGEEAICLLFVQLFEVRYPLMLGHLCASPFPDCSDYDTPRGSIHRSAWKGNSANFAMTAFYEVQHLCRTRA
jgi:hypothetical protein